MLKLAATYSSHSIRKIIEVLRVLEQKIYFTYHRHTLINIKVINTSIAYGSIDNFGGSKDRVIEIKGDINPLELPCGTRTAQILDQKIIAI